MNRDDELHDDQALERLLNRAGARPEPPAEMEREVREAVRAVWLDEQYAPRRRLAPWALAASVALLAILSLWLWPDAGDEPLMTVARVTGEASVWHKGRWELLETGEVLDGRFRIRTGSGRLALATGEGVELRLDQASEIARGGHRLTLGAGAVYLDLGAGEAAPWTVSTSLGEVRHIGTRFAVRLLPSTLAVQVRDGEVAVETAAGEARLTAGQRLEADAVSLSPVQSVTAWDPSWDWAESVAPPLRLDGRTLAEFLDWFSHETGRSVDYGARIGRSDVRETRLHGDVSGLNPEQALRAVVATTRFTVELEERRVLIQAR